MVLKKEDGVQVINGVKSIKVTYKHVWKYHNETPLYN
jgi:hypothetical protein